MSDNTGAMAGMPSGVSTATSTDSRDVSARIAEWHLAPSDIQSDLDRSMTIVRTRQMPANTSAAFLDDSVVITLVKSKLQADNELSSLTLDVQSHNGEVQLKGKAQSAAQIGRAIAMALDTEGVAKVSSDITLSPPTK